MVKTTIEQQNENTATIYLSGRLDVSAAHSVEGSFGEATRNYTNIVLDLSELDYIASAGLRLVKRLFKQVRENGGDLSVINVQEDVMEIFEMTGFVAILFP